MSCDIFAGEHAAVAVADDDGIVESFTGQVLRRQLVVLDALGDGLVSAADAFPAVVCAHRVVPAPVEREVFVTARRNVRREKARGADIEIHLIAVAIHRRALARPVRCVVGAVEGMSGCRDADEFGVHNLNSSPSAFCNRGLITSSKKMIELYLGGVLRVYYE